MKNTNRKYHQLVLIWVSDPAKYQTYLQKLRPIVAKYGGKADRIFQPTSIWAEGLELPHIVNLVHYDSKKAFDVFKDDPDFKKIVPLRSESIKMISFEGYLNVENSSSAGLKERMYNIELVYYKNGLPETYRKYEAEGEKKMKDYGFEIEFVMAIEAQSVQERQPDLAKISYFKSAADKANFEKDPMHKTIEEALYPAAIDKVIWITGQIHPMMLE
jgi:uncharacterized protein (DUF1330 family)